MPSYDIYEIKGEQINKTFTHTGKFIEATDIRQNDKKIKFEALTYSFENIFMPTAYHPNLFIKYADVHGNEYTEADWLITEKLDLLVFYGTYVEDPSIFGYYYCQQTADRFSITESDFTVTYTNLPYRFYGGVSMEFTTSIDLFPEYTPPALPDGVTDGFGLYPLIIPPDFEQFIPLPAYAGGSDQVHEVTNLSLLRSDTTTSTIRYLLPKLCTPLYLTTGFSTHMRVTLIPRKRDSFTPPIEPTEPE